MKNLCPQLWYLCVKHFSFYLFSCLLPPVKKKAQKSTITGTIYQAMPSFYIYVYKDNMDLKGPAFAETISDKDSNSSLQLPLSKCFLVARMRSSGEIAGPIEVGDFKSEVIGPITINEDGKIMKQDIKVLKKPVKAKILP